MTIFEFLKNTMRVSFYLLQTIQKRQNIIQFNSKYNKIFRS